jgi:hypothetical protein
VAGRQCALLGELFERRALFEHVVADGGKPAVWVGAESEPLNGRCSMTNHSEHLLAGDGDLDRPLDDFGGNGREDDTGAAKALS